jgi:hypothetical protein
MQTPPHLADSPNRLRRFVRDQPPPGARIGYDAEADRPSL